MIHHPDKNGDPEVFKALAIVHSILSDEEKRKLFDDTGDIDDDGEFNRNEDHWYDYFRTLFPKVTVEAIQKFSDQYIGSEEERRDVMKAYNEYDGFVPHIMEVVLLAEDEHRICSIIDDLIDAKRLSLTPAYSDYRSKMKRKVVNQKPKKKLKSSKHEADLGTLEAMIKSNTSSREKREASLFSNILQKYDNSSKSKVVDDIPDDEFLKFQQNMLNSRQASSSSSKSKKL